MRYIAYGLAILAALLTVSFATGYLPRDATASHNEANDTINVLQMERTIGAKALPRQNLPDEVYRQASRRWPVKSSWCRACRCDEDHSA